MSKNCVLNKESAARANLAIEKFTKENYELIITSGWAYRSDCSVPISDVVKKFILNNSKINHKSIVSLPSSRDTVGDAYYCFKYLQDKHINQLSVITSDYHVKRVEFIFKKLFNSSHKVIVFGAKTDKNKRVLALEKKSIAAFKKTFSQTDFDDAKSIFLTLSTKHPFYNGEIYPKI